MEYDYGEELREKRLRLRLKQSDIASKLGCSKVIISNMENGIREIRVIELHKLYNFFGIDVGLGEIFEWIDSRNKELLSKIKKHTGVKFCEKEIGEIKARKYDTMNISTLKKIEKILNFERDYNTNNSKEHRGKIKLEEKEQLNGILEKYIQRDGNIERALKLLEIAVQ